MTIAESYYRNLFESSTDGMIILDAETGKILDVNPCLAKMLEFSKEEIFDEDISASGFFKKIAPDHKIFVEIFQNESVRYKDLPLITFYGRPLNVDFASHLYSVDTQNLVHCNIRDITGHKIAENELKFTNELLSMFVKNSPIHAFIKEVTPNESRVLIASENYRDMIGIPGSEMDGKNMYELFPNEFAAKMTADDWDVVSKGQILKIDEDFKNRNYTTIKFPILFEGRSLLAGYTIDITEQKQAGEKLKESEHRFRTVFENTLIGIYRTAPDGKIFLVNPALVKMLGYDSAEELLKRNLEDEGFDPLAPRNNFKDIIEREGVLEGFESSWISKDGTTVFVKESASAYYDSDGKILFYEGIVEDITDHKRAKEKIQEHEERFRKIFEDGPMGMVIVDSDMHFVKANAAFCNMTGYSENELNGLKIMDITHPDNLDADIKNIQKLFRGEMPLYKSEKRYITKNKETIWGSLTSTVIRDSKGEFMYFLSMIEDITERKLTEGSMQKLNLAIRQSREIIFITDKEGIITFINPEFTNTYGYSAEEVLGKVTPRILKSGLLDPKVYENFWKEVLSKKSLKNEYINKCRDGRLIDIEGSADPILDENGEIIGFLGIHREITERKHAEEMINTLGKAIEHGPSAIVITDANGKIEFINNKFTALTQYSFEEVHGKNPRVFNKGHLPEKEFEELWKILRKGDTWIGEVQNRKKDGTLFWEDLTISALMNPDDTISKYILVMNDTTERKQMMEDLVAAKEKAEESDRLKSAFLANMGHEIRTPMNIIMGFAEQLNDPDLTGEEKKEYLDIIEKSGRGLLDIFNDIVSISKVEAGQMPVSVTEVNINETIEQIYSSFSVEAEQKGIVIIYDNGLTGQQDFINTDREKVNTILTNLVKNAIKFTNAGFIEIGHKQKGAFLEFYVKDTGLGINPEQLKIIFEPFRQGSESLRRNYEGVGLGLSISKSYVEMLGGRIWVESSEGTGSVFYFTLPYNIEADRKNMLQPVAVVSAYQEDSSFNNLKILIAEDNEYAAKLLGKIVKPDARGILIANTGTRAVEICRENPDIDLVLMDIQMPEMNGIEATKQIRKFNTDVMIIAQTAFVYTHNRDEAIEAGCNDYMTKPVDQALLRKLVKEHFEKS